ncbi:MAG: hypothetical protein AAFX99_29190, partial [Myxococcota bacterium]
MTELARRERLSYPLDALHYIGHWITPTFERRRFNTRFYIAIAPAGQEPLHDDKEVVASAWWTPSEAIDRYRTGEIQLAPPTFRTLEEMSAYNSVETLVKGMTQGPIPTIMPRLESIDGAMTLLLPGDPLMPSHTGVEGPTRLVLEDDQWWSRHP